MYFPYMVLASMNSTTLTRTGFRLAHSATGHGAPWCSSNTLLSFSLGLFHQYCLYLHHSLRYPLSFLPLFLQVFTFLSEERTSFDPWSQTTTYPTPSPFSCFSFLFSHYLHQLEIMAKEKVIYLSVISGSTRQEGEKVTQRKDRNQWSVW